MDSFLQTPEWLGTAVIGAIIAALGYVIKMIIELFQIYLEKKRINRSKLIELRSLLRASWIAFKIQNKHAKRLTTLITETRSENAEKLMGYENIISSSYDNLNKEQKELHAIIRGITVTALYPTNKAVLEWLRGDTFFKAKRNALAIHLMKLESHLILWLAKYEAWIPANPAHALIYMADEEKHGLGFPTGIDNIIDKKTGLSWEETDEL